MVAIGSVPETSRDKPLGDADEPDDCIIMGMRLVSSFFL